MTDLAFDGLAPITHQKCEQAIAANGGRLVVFLRYTRNLTRAEVDLIHSHGCSVAPIWEGNGNEGLLGPSAGHVAGIAANAALDAIGCPSDVLIFYVTTDAPNQVTPAQYGTVAGFLDAAGSHGRPQAQYDGEDTCAWMVANGHSHAGWIQGASSYSHGHYWENGTGIVLRQKAGASPVPETDQNDVLGPFRVWGPFQLQPPEDDMPPYTQWADADRRALAADVRGEIVGEPGDPNQDYGSVTLKGLAAAQAQQFQALCQLIAEATGKTLTWDQGAPKIG